MNRPDRTAISHRIVWALALSLAIHLLFWFGPQIHLSFNQAQPEPLEARLILPQKPIPAASKELKPRPKPRTHRPQPPATRTIKETAPDPSKETAFPSMAEATPPANPASTEAHDSPAQEESPQQKTTPPFPLPRHAEIQFNLYKGENGLSVGKVVQTWQMQDNRYSLTSVAQATGIFSLIKSGKFVQTSQGKLTEHGLEPDAFWIQRGQSADSTESAQLDHKNKILTLSSAQNNTTLPLPDGTQDLLSFAYQIAIDPPQTGRTIKLFITNGRKLDSYEYQVIGEEWLELPQGKTKALHLSKVHNPKEDGTDIWLGIEQYYLPIKIRFTDRDGGVAEQVASEIQIKPTKTDEANGVVLEKQ